MTTQPDNNVVWHHATVTRQRREKLHGHRGAVLWFTGLSASGKSTLAHAVEEALHQNRCRTFVLDGDNVRHGLNSDLGFTIKDRDENLRRVGETAKLFLEAGTIVLAAFISPLRREREMIRNLMPHGDFYEIYCAASIDVCEQRDPKGMYEKARKGEIHEFTGISSPYEAPVKPELTVNTGKESVEVGVKAVLEMLQSRQVIN
ncbi:MAG: adenylyl-sulfate kinase [Pseudomonadota bacterium]